MYFLPSALFYFRSISPFGLFLPLDILCSVILRSVFLHSVILRLVFFYLQSFYVRSFYVRSFYHQSFCVRSFYIQSFYVRSITFGHGLHSPSAQNGSSRTRIGSIKLKRKEKENLLSFNCNFLSCHLTSQFIILH
jgi:hypothetical protein